MSQKQYWVKRFRGTKGDLFFYHTLKQLRTHFWTRRPKNNIAFGASCREYTKWIHSPPKLGYRLYVPLNYFSKPELFITLFCSLMVEPSASTSQTLRSANISLCSEQPLFEKHFVMVSPDLDGREIF